jgi:hypothetical protein
MWGYDYYGYYGYDDYYFSTEDMKYELEKLEPSQLFDAIWYGAHYVYDHFEEMNEVVQTGVFEMMEPRDQQ